MKTTRTCPYCQNNFLQKHGNQVYCSSSCQEQQKAETEFKLYGLIKEFRKGFLANYKLFEQVLPNTGTVTHKLSDLTNNGLKHNCFFGAFTDRNNKSWFKVSKYQFTIFEKEKTFLITLINK